MSALPCKNPSCKSFGTAHPNCKCYAEMAKGGKVSGFCDSKRDHKKSCQYFAEGTPDNVVEPDTGNQVSTDVSNQAVPDASIPADNAQDATPQVADNAIPSSTEPANKIDSPQADIAPPSAPNATLVADTDQPSAQNKNNWPQINVPQIKTPEHDAIQRKLDTIAFAHDLDNGMIKPETYSDLFAKKDTLGKIGTLFGLLVSGAGSGLSGQSNAVMDMMNKQIQNDIEAQKTNQGNRQTWYSMAMKQEANTAAIDSQNADTAAKLVGVHSAGLDAQAKSYRNAMAGMPATNASTMATNYVMAAIPHIQQNSINRLAPGPGQQQAQWTLDNVLKPNVAQMINNNLDQLAQKKATLEAINPDPVKKAVSDAQQNPNLAIDPRGPAVDMDKLTKAENAGLFAPGLPKTISPEDAKIIDSEVKGLQQNRTNYADAEHAFNVLQNTVNAGQSPGLNIANAATKGVGTVGGGFLGGALGAGLGLAATTPITAGIGAMKDMYERTRNQLIEPLKNRLRKDLSEEQKTALVNAILPSWVDRTPENLKTGHDLLVQHFKSQETGENFTPRLNYYDQNIPGLKKPFPEIPYIPPKSVDQNSAALVPGNVGTSTEGGGATE